MSVKKTNGLSDTVKESHVIAAKDKMKTVQTSLENVEKEVHSPAPKKFAPKLVCTILFVEKEVYCTADTKRTENIPKNLDDVDKKHIKKLQKKE